MRKTSKQVRSHPELVSLPHRHVLTRVEPLCFTELDALATEEDEEVSYLDEVALPSASDTALLEEHGLVSLSVLISALSSLTFNFIESPKFRARQGRPRLRLLTHPA